MTIWKTIPFALGLLVLQAQAPPVAPMPEGAVPLYRVSLVKGSAKAFDYRNLKRSTKIDLKGTQLAPNASGVAEVESRAARIQITAHIKNLPLASSFGGEFLTYVMWGISPEGRATNLGEVLLKKGKGKLVVTEQLLSFGLVVTAEPYFAVTQPSDVVVLENLIAEKGSGPVEFVDAKFELLKRGQYALNLVSGDPLIMNKKTPFEVYQARNAMRIAQATGAMMYAPEAFDKAKSFLQKAEVVQVGSKERVMLAREAVQRAEDARLIAVQRQAAEQVVLERKWAEDKVDEAKKQAAIALAAQNAAVAKTVEAETTNEALRTKNDGLRSKNEGLQSRNEGLRARNEELRSKLLDQLNAVLQTRATARGLIVNMSGVLFENGQATLLPPAKEKLAKIAGILTTYKGLNIEVDGFTDTTGTDEFNVALSQKRADAAKTYLVSQGISPGSITSGGFGKANPIATNDTEAGRAANRRVELLVTGEDL